MIPASLQHIDVTWLGTVLPQAPSSVAVVDAHHGTTGRGLLRLGYSPGTCGPETLFVKLPPPDPRQREFVASTQMGRKESLFYARLAAELPIRVPRCYFADADESGYHYIMLLEDLNASGCEFRNATTAYSQDYVNAVLDAFADLHGAYLDSPRFERDLSWIEPPMAHAMGPLLVEKAVSRYGAELPTTFTDAGELYLQNHAAIHALWREGLPTLCHGDVHDGNLFRDAMQPGFLDWAVINRTSGMRDVAYFMVGSVKPDDRVTGQDALLRRYHHRLSERADRAPSMADLVEQYRWHALYTWVAAATTVAMGDQWQPVDYVLRSLRRVHRALDDLDSLAAIRQAL